MEWHANTQIVLSGKNRIELVIPEVNINDWQDFIDFLRSTSSILEFYINDRPLELPDRIHDVLIRVEPDRCLKISLHGISAECRFASARNIQLTIDISEINRDKNVHTLFRLMSTVGLVLNKRVIMNMIDITDIGYFRYEPGEGMQYFAEG
jgi:hypothetical protein